MRFSFDAFALLGEEGLSQLKALLNRARELGFYTLLDGPQILSPWAADRAAALLVNEEYPCQGMLISPYIGSDAIKPFVPACAKGEKDLFIVVRSANKSALELQDLLSGGRLVHAAAADHVNRYSADTVGKFGYSRVGVLAAASAAQNLKDLRNK